MFIRTIARLLLTAGLPFCVGVASAATIATVELQSSITDPALSVDDAAATRMILGGVGFSVEFSGLDAGTTIGSVVTATANGPDFDIFVATVTNGIDNALEIFTGVTAVGVFDYLRETESVWFAGVPGLAGPDLAGYVIDAIEITVTDIEFVSGTDNTLASRTTVSFQGHAVPVPAAWLLMTSALAGLGATGRLRRDHSDRV